METAIYVAELITGLAIAGAIGWALVRFARWAQGRPQ